MAFTIKFSWHLRKRPVQGLERRLHGLPSGCSVLYNMAFTMAFYHGIYHFMAFTEASSPGPPGRAWRGGFMVFLLGALCYTICTMKAPPQALPGEEPSWHLFLVRVVFDKA